MIVNDLNNNKINIKTKKFSKEITIDDDDGESIAYVFPDTKEFINIIKRKLIQEKFITIVEGQEQQKVKVEDF